MAETLNYSDTSVKAPAAPAEAQEVGPISHDAFNTLETSAGIILSKRDLRLAQAERDSFDSRYDGLIARQTSEKALSLALADDIFIDFRRNAQRAGFTEVDQMSLSERVEAARVAAETYRPDIFSELQSAHSPWSLEDLQAATDQRISDVITLLSMSRGEQDDYRHTILKYYQATDRIAEIEHEIAEFRAERQKHVKNLGKFVINSLVKGAHALRDAPYAAGARLTLGASRGVQRIRSWYTRTSPEGKKAVLFTAAGIAVAGVAAYVFSRLSGPGSSPETTAFTLASYTSDETADTLNGVSIDIGESGDSLDSSTAENIGLVSSPENIGAGTALDIGSVSDDISSGTAENIGMTGTDLSSAKASSELFADHTPVNNWPHIITVDKWNAQNYDGSLSGISRQLLRRSGVASPTSDQIKELVDVLRPQAQPNGWLLHGQKLDLRPALSLLKTPS